MNEFTANHAYLTNLLSSHYTQAKTKLTEKTHRPLENTTQISVKNANDLERLFHGCFFEKYNTVLVGNAEEPLYQPTITNVSANQIFYRYDYFASALHEIAHWCIAGEKRRTQVDYGYWYAPDGRNPQQQTEFEQLEVKPQALEWAFSLAANVPFRVSIDNLNAIENKSVGELDQLEKAFTDEVKYQLNCYVKSGFSARAQFFLSSLHTFYQSAELSEQI